MAKLLYQVAFKIIDYDRRTDVFACKPPKAEKH